MMAFNDLVFRISAQGTDSRGLGRWSYIKITGKIIFPQLYSMDIVLIVVHLHTQHVPSSWIIWLRIKKKSSKYYLSSTIIRLGLET